MDKENKKQINVDFDNNNQAKKSEKQNKGNGTEHCTKLHGCLTCKHFSRFYTRNYRNFEKQDCGICHNQFKIMGINESCFNYIQKDKQFYMQDHIYGLVEKIYNDITILKRMTSFEFLEDYNELLKEK